MAKKDKDYFINTPIFVKYKTRFNFLKLTRICRVKTVYINERIVELPFVFQYIAQDRNKIILDVGCSESPLPIHMASLGNKVIGLDSRNYPYFHPNLRFTRANVLLLPFKDKSFDLVTCISTLEHIGLGFYQDPIEEENADFKAMKEIYRVLKDKGTLLISIPVGKEYQITIQQRIYSLKRLQAIFSGFTIQKQYFFANFYPEEKNNYWREIEKREVLNMSSMGGNTNCIALVVAIKNERLFL